MKEYEDEFWQFIEQPNFVRLINVFTRHPDLQPNTVLGLPIIVVHLANAWKSYSMTELKEYLPFLEEQKVQLQSIGLRSAMIIFAIFPQYINEVMSYIYARRHHLKNEGIEIQMPRVPKVYTLHTHVHKGHCFNYIQELYTCISSISPVQVIDCHSLFSPVQLKVHIQVHLPGNCSCICAINNYLLYNRVAKVDS